MHYLTKIEVEEHFPQTLKGIKRRLRRFGLGYKNSQFQITRPEQTPHYKSNYSNIQNCSL